MTSDARFAFGANWLSFIQGLTDGKIAEAEQSLKDALGQIKGKSFLDIGSGSGLFSLAAVRLGASVTSLDYDPQAVECARQLKQRFAPHDANWAILQGSATDEALMRSLGEFDIVYSWGVLHHTGDMWLALDLAMDRLRAGSTLHISIYNDQGAVSTFWKRIKRFYVGSPRWLQFLLCLGTVAFFEGRSLAIQIVLMRNVLRWIKNRRQGRGMSVWHDARDWVGGYPFEVAKPEEIFSRCLMRGLNLTHLKTCGGGIGCNEYTFHKG